MIIDKLIYAIGAEVDKEAFRGAAHSLDGIAKSMKRVIGVAAAVTGALVGFATMSNRNTAEQIRLSQSVGASVETMDALGTSISQIGLNFENGIDLVEELNNKFGEMKALGEFTAVEESMEALNLKFADLQQLAPEDQFIKIMDTAYAMKDAQKAAFAVDSLFGGEGNKILGHLRATNESLSEKIKLSKELNFQTKESQKGALAHTKALGKTLKIFETISKLFSGVLGKSLAKVNDSMNEWLITNKEMIQQDIASIAEALGWALQRLGEAIRYTIEGIRTVTEYFGGFINVIKIFMAYRLAAMIITVVSALRTFITVLATARGAMVLFSALFAATPIGLLITALTAFILLAEDFYKWVNGNTEGTLMGHFFGDSKDAIARWTAGLSEAWNEAVEFVGKVTDSITNGFDILTESLRTFFTETLAVWFTDITTWLASLPAAFMDTFATIGTIISDAIGNAVKRGWDAAKGYLASGISGIVELFGGDATSTPGATGAPGAPGMMHPAAILRGDIPGTMAPASQYFGNTSTTATQTKTTNINNNPTVNIHATGVASGQELGEIFQDTLQTNMQQNEAGAR